MMKFDLLEGEERIRTENGAIGYKTTKNALLDLSFKVPELRREVCDDKSVDLWRKYVKKAYEEDPLNTMRFLLYLRDARGGLGERDAFRNIIRSMAADDSELGYRVIKFGDIPYFGRWDDLVDALFTIDDNRIKTLIIDFIGLRLKNDLCSYYNDKDDISLLAKWLPSESASSPITRDRAHKMARYLGISLKQYRKDLSKLRKHLNIVEEKMSNRNWEEINYEHVPSKANLVYKDAFMRHDQERRTAYLESLKKGEVKINAGVLSPYEIIHKYIDLTHLNYYNYDRISADDTLESLWKALPKPEKQKNVLVVRDGSGSMCTRITNTSDVTAMDVGDSLALYMAQFNTGDYKDKFITFSSRPEIVDLSRDKTLINKLTTLRLEYTECSNTNLEAVFDLVLHTAAVNNVPPEEIPDILIISDMEFDQGTRQFYPAKGIYDQDTLMEGIRRKWNACGLDLPKLVYWNVNSRTGAIPIRQNDNGLILVSGFTPAIANMVLSNEVDPWKALLKVLEKERYSCLDDVIGK